MNTLLIMFIILVFLLYYSFNTNEHFYNDNECYNAEKGETVVFNNNNDDHNFDAFKQNKKCNFYCNDINGNIITYKPNDPSSIEKCLCYNSIEDKYEKFKLSEDHDINSLKENETCNFYCNDINDNIITYKPNDPSSIEKCVCYNSIEDKNEKFKLSEDHDINSLKENNTCNYYCDIENNGKYTRILYDSAIHTGMGAKYGGNCYDDADTHNNPAFFNNSAAAAVATAAEQKVPGVKDKSNSQIAKSKSNSESKAKAKAKAKAKVFSVAQFDNTCCTDTILCNDEFIKIKQVCNSLNNTSNVKQNVTSSSQLKYNTYENENNLAETDITPEENETNLSGTHITPDMINTENENIIAKLAHSKEFAKNGQLCSTLTPDELSGSGCGKFVFNQPPTTPLQFK